MTINAIHKEDGKITLYRLDDGKIIDPKKCIKLVKAGKIENCNIGRNRSKHEFIRMDRKGKKDDANKITRFADMPTF